MISSSEEFPAMEEVIASTAESFPVNYSLFPLLWNYVIVNGCETIARENKKKPSSSSNCMSGRDIYSHCSLRVAGWCTALLLYTKAMWGVSWWFFFFTKPLLLLQNTILQNITYNARLITLFYLQKNTYDTYNVGYPC